MKKSIVFGTALCAILSGGLFFTACENPNLSMDVTHASHTDLRKRDVKVKKEQPILATGKIYTKDNFLYVSEPGKGIHVIDNSNPSAPQKVRFVAIPGNMDVAMKGDILYADSYMDLLAIDMKTNKVTRVNDVFKASFDDMRKEGRFAGLGADGDFLFAKNFQAVHKTPSNVSTNVSSETGTAGSMARFAVVDNNLYVLDGKSMKVFSVTAPAEPKQVSENKMEFEVETIFPYKEHLFIGGKEGMFVYDNTNPNAPTQISKFQHMLSCDPVIVANDIAYITLRDGSQCRTAINELQVVDVKDVKNPTLIKVYPMNNPHGLSVKGNNLYVCDGNQGLKILDITNPADIQPVAKDPSLRKAFDVINTDKSMIVVGRDGIFQYDNTDPKALKQLSVIPVTETVN